MTTANQRAFNKAYRGLKSQDFQMSADHYGSCFYRDEAGLKCAAGWLIPDSKYKPEWEGRSYDCLPRGLFGKADLGLIASLQTAHDQSTGPKSMQASLTAVARHFGLIVHA